MKYLVRYLIVYPCVYIFLLELVLLGSLIAAASIAWHFTLKTDTVNIYKCICDIFYSIHTKKFWTEWERAKTVFENILDRTQ
jgi:hypothetical protein